LIDGVAPGEIARAKTVGDYLTFTTEGLHHHHAAEYEPRR